MFTNIAMFKALMDAGSFSPVYTSWFVVDIATGFKQNLRMGFDYQWLSPARGKINPVWRFLEYAFLLGSGLVSVSQYLALQPMSFF